MAPVAPLPCPFCGGTDIDVDFAGPRGYIYAGCNTCTADGPEVPLPWEQTSIDAAGRNKAIAAWNRRAPTDKGVRANSN